MRGLENSQLKLIISFWCAGSPTTSNYTKHHHRERAFQSFLCQSPRQTLRSPLLLLRGLIKHGDLDFNKTGLQQNAAVGLLPEPLFSPGTGKARSLCSCSKFCKCQHWSRHYLGFSTLQHKTHFFPPAHTRMDLLTNLPPLYRNKIEREQL